MRFYGGQREFFVTGHRSSIKEIFALIGFFVGIVVVVKVIWLIYIGYFESIEKRAIRYIEESDSSEMIVWKIRRNYTPSERYEDWQFFQLENNIYLVGYFAKITNETDLVEFYWIYRRDNDFVGPVMEADSFEDFRDIMRAGFLSKYKWIMDRLDTKRDK